MEMMLSTVITSHAPQEVKSATAATAESPEEGPSERPRWVSPVIQRIDTPMEVTMYVGQRG